MDRLLAMWWGMTRAQRRFWQMAILLGVACCGLYLWGNDRYGLFDVDEAIFTEASIEMIHSGSLAMPTYNGEPRYHKPPLIYWTQAGFMELLGEDSLYAARLPSVISALLTLLLLGVGVAQLTGSRRWGLMAAMVMGLNLSFLVVGKSATADGLLNLTTLALSLWVVHVLYPGSLKLQKAEEEKIDAKLLTARIKQVAAKKAYHNRQWLVTGVLAGLGFLAKGPVAWLPSLLMVVAVLVLRKDRGEVWRRLAPFKSGFLMLAMLLPWLILLVAQHGLEFFYEFFVVNNFGRYAGGLTNTQSKSHFFYIAVLLTGFYPWVFVLPKATQLVLKGGIRRVRRVLAGDDASAALPLLCLVWAVGYIVFFSCSQTRLSHYIVPAYPALAMLVGGFLAQVPRLKVPPMAMLLAALWGLIFGLVFLALNPLLLGLREPVFHGWLGWLQAALGFAWPPKDPIATAVLALPIPLNAAAGVLGVLIILAVVPSWYLMARGQKSGILMLAGSWAVCLALMMLGVVPVVWRYTQSSLVDMARVIGEAPDTTGIIHLAMHKPSVLYLSQRRFTKLDSPLQLPDYVTSAETLVLTKQDRVEAVVRELGLKGGAQVVGLRCRGGYCLLNVALPKLPAGVIDTGGRAVP